MRDVSDAFLEAVAGSNSPVVTCDVWLDGEVIRSGLRPVGGTVEFDMFRDVEARLSSLTLVDEESDGSRLSQTIHALGTQVNVRAGFDIAGTEETVSLGWFDVHDVVRQESWSWFDWSDEAQKTSDVATLEGLDLMGVVARSQFLTPPPQTTGADAWATIADLCAGVVSVLDPGLPARTIPESLVFQWDRLETIKQIAALWGAKPVMTPDNQLTLVTDESGDVIADFGLRINLADWESRSNSENIRNGVTFVGKDGATGLDLIGTATESDGPARWGGPLGFRPLRAASDLMDTQAKVDAAAKTRLETEIRSRAVVQEVSALWHPGIELRDKPRLVLPDRTEDDAMIVGYRLPLTGGSMSVSLGLPVIL
ncbi:hypothetical protein [Cryobacterium sp. BB736]|uniref:hypothetical protein n=1 Tax=Cryobacterium sp. BB736 TaxID=2746963 RepID=UPI001874F9DF|nr:hypothetical protein [Cryobacterium sp. BB736]